MNIKYLWDKLDNIIFDTKEKLIYLYEMSLPQGKVMNRVRDLSIPIFEHTMKVILYGIEEERTLHHWCHELNSWFSQCVAANIKRRGKDTPPNEQELFKWLTDYYNSEEDVVGVRKCLEHEYTYQGHEIRTCTNYQIYSNIIKFYGEICRFLAKRQNTDDLIEKIIKKYRLG